MMGGFPHSIISQNCGMIETKLLRESFQFENSEIDCVIGSTRHPVAGTDKYRGDCMHSTVTSRIRITP